MTVKPYSTPTHCIQCGTCTGSCPSGRYTALNIRRIIRKASKNRNNETLLRDETLWTCTTCYNCQERCPRNIAVADALLEIRALAVHRGIILPRHKVVAENLIRTGHAVPIDDENRAHRRDIGLAELPETVHSYPEHLEEVKALVQAAKFHKLIEGAP
ncbi:MAG: CoB--CoM heterodisulfide reductase subunit C [Mariprofundales bacterium]|nr:CoB--CoM heterodisulfide reductase subunit C [Mariprofundales bacterium]